ncbi:DUF2750 domain-containing protein [Marinobacter shengliensis]|uniref:DUF2750 domain-containing protein n=1 Tax=Marinobacter shengliensis TaxID=1389223 RepID=UPI000D0FF58B|nr:DUF2750 domain-containing protein [Marinobacter shengliensis]PSF14880.1 hypothetical protein C7H10_03215 [Marinobacter shengliensis]
MLAALRFVVDKALSNWMNVEIIGDREFIASVQGQDGVWVLMAGQSLYALPAEGGRDLPVWSSAENAEVFAENLNQRGLSPVFVPMSNFLGAAWLGSSSLQIVDVLASPRNGQESLTYTAEELRARLKT